VAAALEAIVLGGPYAAVDRVRRWRSVDLCRVVEERWGVAYGETGMLRLLWSVGRSHRKTRPVHPRTEIVLVAPIGDEHFTFVTHAHALRVVKSCSC